jgi:hypothetical protein
MIKVDKATVKVSEQTVKELMRAIEQAKEKIEFTDEPIPDGDMDIETYNRYKASRGEITVSSQYAPVKFEIAVEKRPHSQESCGYKLEYAEGVK